MWFSIALKKIIEVSKYEDMGSEVFLHNWIEISAK